MSTPRTSQILSFLVMLSLSYGVFFFFSFNIFCIPGEAKKCYRNTVRKAKC